MNWLAKPSKPRSSNTQAQAIPLFSLDDNFLSVQSIPRPLAPNLTLCPLLRSEHMNFLTAPTSHQTHSLAPGTSREAVQATAALSLSRPRFHQHLTEEGRLHHDFLLSTERTHKAASRQRRFNVTTDTTSFKGPLSCPPSKATCSKTTAGTKATSEGRGSRRWSPGPAHTVRASVLLHGAPDRVWDMNTKVRAFSRQEPLGIFEATGKRLIEAD